MKLNLFSANDNRPRIDADFMLPERFIAQYNQDLLRWAGDLQAVGPILEIHLWNFPDATILTPGWQGSVKLRCDTLQGSDKSLLFVIQPDGEEDVERVRKHCEALPTIMAAHRAKAEATKGTARGSVRAVFNLPEYFVERYGVELRAWGRNLAKIGLVKTIVLREGTLSDISAAEDQGAVLLGVKLKAEIERLKNDEMRLVISPATEQDERIVRNHVQKMTTAGIKPRADLVEPPRPGMPFLPTSIGATRHPDGGI
jgi:hypothetical protein